ncbi:MAG: TonB-dependent receptor plug domain-containing protein [Desulfosoma sp.]|uniref:TonB-dependent receptor plug domain-containing protein n=1 Tax=Desulfosoma sp. TaxID=2603217 RepID=UPI00404B503C
MNRPLRLMIIACFVWQAVMNLAATGVNAGADFDDGTSLMFLGEDTDVLTLATRREESAAKAPAVAQVLTRQDFWDRGDTTLADVLAYQPGFFMAPKEYGSRPYLRGIPESTLFLFNAVPLRSEASKGFHPIDQDLSLAGIKRIEIVRGAASVLWGLDAFSGVVNVVPLTGTDFQGLETGVLTTTDEDARQAYINVGGNGPWWSGFGSLTLGTGGGKGDRATVVRFWDGPNGAPVPVTDRYGSDHPDSPNTLDLSGNMTLGKAFTVSGRIARNRTPYVLSSADKDLSWIEERRTNTEHIKADFQKALTLDTSLKASAYYLHLAPHTRIIDRDFSQGENTLYAETVLEKSLMTGRGLITAGASFKKTQVEEALIWKNYFPDYLGPDNTAFLPVYATKDFDHSLSSAFVQYLHKTKSWDAMAGLRWDVHNEYEDSLNTSFGLVWHPTDVFTMKFLYGTSFRSPYARQYAESRSAKKLEKARNFSVQAVWRPNARLSGEVTGFFTKICDHVMEDPFAGVSLANEQKFVGLEASARFHLTDSLSLHGNLTALTHSGPDEVYRYTEYGILGPGGDFEETIVDLTYPFDVGPKTFGNAAVLWTPTKHLSARLRLRSFSEMSLIYPRGAARDNAPDVWLLDLDAAYKDFLTPKLDLIAAVTNLTDRDHEIPGTYSMIDGRPLTLHLHLRYRW